ncbi:MAG: hypothetical protein GTN69_12025 [Armatimonadetes bacterium]|nr:hypothetical protein [Armatimonadota bacterium]
MSVDAPLVTLRFFGALRDTIGQKEVCLPCAGGTVKEILLRFVEEHGDAVRHFIFDEQGNQWRSLLLLLNDEPIEDNQETHVKAGDVISLLLPLAGG